MSLLQKVADDWSSLSARLVRHVRAIAETPEMLAVQRALPISFVGLAVGLIYFMAALPGGTLLERFSQTFGEAFGLMSVVLVLVLADDLARRRDVPRVLAVAVAGSAFALSLPYRAGVSVTAIATALGSSGLFLAIGIALGSTDLLAFARRRFGAAAGLSLASLVVVSIAAILLALGISVTGALDVAIAPLGDLGDSLTALLIISAVETLLWTVGIHGPALLAAVVLPVYMHLQVQNTEAVAHGEPLPHIVTVSMFLFIFPGGAGATLPLELLLLRSKVKRLRSVALATLLPSLANTNEPLIFGLPLVFNPALTVPFVVTPLVLAVVSWWAMNLGLVAKPAYYVPYAIPLPIAVFLATKDWRSEILIALNIALGVAIYAPFVRVYERNEARREHERAENAPASG